MLILVYHCVTILLAKMLIWASFSQLMCTFFLLSPDINGLIFVYKKIPSFGDIPIFFLAHWNSPHPTPKVHPASVDLGVPH